MVQTRRLVSAGALAAVVLIAVALAGSAPAARAAAAKCPNLTVTEPSVTTKGVPVTNATVLRFVLQGAGCQESRRAIKGLLRRRGCMYFWGSVSAEISGPGQNPLVPGVRPSRIFLTNDGASVLINVHWSSWGGSTATATATDSASNGIPSIAPGTRTNTPATVALSDPGVFENHRVYRCFAMAIPSKNSSFSSCLKNENGYWFFM